MKYLVAHLCTLDGNGPTPNSPDLTHFSLIANVDKGTELDQFTRTMLSCLEVTPKLNSMDQMERLLKNSVIVWLN